jgi:hypothetical protein
MKQNKNIPNNFNPKSYITLNKDLIGLTDEQARKHYEYYGYRENRKYSVIPDDFDYLEYLKLNTDIQISDELNARLHYENYGYYEKRIYKNTLLFNEKSIQLNTDISYYLSCKNNKEKIFLHFLKIYDISSSQFVNDARIQFRFTCFKNIQYIKNITIPVIPVKSDYEAVLVEYRCLPHLEFIIRNNILKLGTNWCFTVICGNRNHEYMQNMCKSISNNIKIIHTPYDNLLPSDYSKFLATTNFWNLLIGRKVLIYQEDSLIFKNNIDEFLYFDYIGAPWPIDSNNNKSGVGNGGLSLRSKHIMIQIIEKKNIEHTIFNSSTLEYMKKTNSLIPPEDVYFTKNMEDLQIGILADRNHGTKFSVESINNSHSFGGHNFWFVDKNWKNRMYKFNVCKFHPNYELGFLEHRGGWKHIVNELINNNFFSENSNIEFFDIIEKHFLWNTDYICKKKWCGIIHCTSKTPEYLNEINIEYMFNNINFIKSLENCIFIITLSPYVTKYLNYKIKCNLGLKIPVHTLKHPVVNNNIPEFTMSAFIQNENKILIQIGQQLRKISSIYYLNNVSCNKLWLTGTRNFDKMRDLLYKEIHYLGLNPSDINKNIKMYYTETFEEYDELLTKNLVFIDLFDAAANNTILECIIRNTPLIVNKIEGVVDYLGSEYPLYFNNLSEIPSLIDGKKITQAHEYLKQMDKSQFTTESFLNGLFNIVNEHLLKFE